MDYMQGSVACSSDSPPPIQTFSNSEQKKQVASTTINLTDSFKLQYTFYMQGHVGDPSDTEWQVVEWLYREGTLNEMNRIRSPFYTVVPSGSRSK